jgi:hypothetical protein
MTRTAARAAAVRLIPIAFGLALLAYVTRRLGWREIVGTLANLRWSIAPVLALYAGHQMARAAALMWCVAPRRVLGFADALWIRLAGEAVEFLTFTGPIASEPTKASLLRRCGLDLPEGLAATLTEYLASTVAAAVTAVIGVSYVLAVLRPIGSVRVAAIVVLVSMLVFLGLIAVGITACGRIAGTAVGAAGRRAVPALNAVAGALTRMAREAPRRLLAILSLEFIAQMFLGLELCALLVGMRLPCAIVRAALMEGVMKFMNAVFFVPGQVGVAEGSYAVIFSAFGFPATAGVTISFARRLRSLATALAGLIALVSLRRQTTGTGAFRAPP